MITPDAALKGFYARASQDAGMKTALGTKAATGSPARFYEGWPADTLTASDLPRATYYMVAPATRRPGVYRVRLEVDGWFWPAAGAAAKREQFTERMIELFDEQHWSVGEARLYCTVITPGRDFPAPPDEPMRRMFELRIEVSPGPAI